MLACTLTCLLRRLLAQYSGVRTFRRHIQLHKDRIPRHRHPRRGSRECRRGCRCRGMRSLCNCICQRNVRTASFSTTLAFSSGAPIYTVVRQPPPPSVASFVSIRCNRRFAEGRDQFSPEIQPLNFQHRILSSSEYFR